MRKHTTMTTGRASLCALGEYLRRHCFFAPLREHVQIQQKTVRYRPIDKLLDALSGILCGAKTIAQNNTTIRTDRAVQRAFGRTGCAEQSTIARTLRACTAENVAQLDKVSWYYLKRYGATPRHRFHDTRLWVDIDLTPLPIGAKAEGSERTWLGRNRSKTGRKTLRITASQYREILHETLLRGKATALPALKAALLEVETHLGWSRERRAQIVLRLDGGFGTTEILNWLLGCHMVFSCTGAAQTVSAYPVLAGRHERCTRLGRRLPGATTAPEGEDHVKVQASLGCKQNII